MLIKKYRKYRLSSLIYALSITPLTSTTQLPVIEFDPQELAHLDTYPSNADLQTLRGPGGEITTAAFQYNIKPADLKTPTAAYSTPSTAQFNINTAGRYYLATEISSRSNSQTSSVILNISTSNVILDLNSKALRPSASSNSTALTAIKVENSLTNIVIKNGVIDGTSSLLITAGVSVGSSCRNLSIDGLQITNIGGSALTLTGASGSENRDITILNSVFTNCSSASTIYGCNLTYCNNVKVSDCDFNAITTSSGTAYALLASNCNTVTCHRCSVSNIGTGNNVATKGLACASSTNLLFSDCVVTTVGASSSGSVAATGFDLADSGCTPARFSNCTATQIATYGGAATGFAVNAPNVILDNCVAKTISTTSGGTAYGFLLSSASGTSLTNCVANNNSSNGTTIGIYLSSANACQLTNCTANNNSSSSTSADSAIGIKVDSANGCSFLNCSASQNNCNAGASSSCSAYGYYYSSSNGLLINHCQALSNSSNSNASDAYGFYFSSCASGTVEQCQACYNNTNKAGKNCAGFYGTGCTALTFKACNGSGNSLPSSDTSGVVAGFWLAGTSVRNKFMSCEACSNNGYAGQAYGVYLAGSSNSNTVVRDCTLEFNNSTAPGSMYGFYDGAADTTTVLINNIAVGQGRCIALLTSSFQFPTGTSMNYYFKFTGDQENPANMIHETDNFNWQTVSTAVQNWSNVSVAVGEVS